ncbi:MAG: DUF2760 domain-containing protein [Candidatus Binatia bacterium]
MQERPNGSTALVVTSVVIAIILAAANVVVLTLTVSATGTIEAPPLTALSKLCLPGLIYFIAAPLLTALVLTLLATRRTPGAVTPREAAAPAPPTPTPPRRHLGLLQQEARLVDFITEDIDGYSDEQVGAAVRAIHAGCRKVLNEHVQLERVFAAEDGSEIVVDKGFDPAAVRLTGNVTGDPPFRGILQHGGWRASKISMPEASPAVDPAIVAPAEVEIP